MLGLAATALLSMCSAGLVATQGRHISLAEGDGAPGVTRFLSQRVELADGTTQSWVTLTRTGDYTDPRYGAFSITPAMLQQMVGNFEKRVLGQDVFIDVSHRPSDGSAGKVLKLSVESGRLRALVEWTPFGLEAVKTRGFAYLSAEYHEAWADNEKQAQHGAVLLGAGLTIRPVIKHLEPITLSEQDAAHADGIRLAVSPSLIRELQEQNVNYIEQLRIKLLALGLSEETVVKLLAEAKKQIEAAGTDQAKCLAIVTTWEATGKAVQDQLKALGATGAQQVTITLAQPAGDMNALVAKALADRDAADATTRTTLAAKVKLLSDTIAAGDTTLTADSVKLLATDVEGQITAITTDDQVKALAELQLKHAKALSAAAKLAGLGYVPIGDARIITVDSSNGIKALQETIDRRLGVESWNPSERFSRTGGKLLAANKAFAEKALALFDAQHGQQLTAEHKMLAAGTGSISDVKVPVVAERTVLREALYNLVSLNFVNVGTAPFANVITVPYSYRDTSAAGKDALRIYELQAIRRAGVIQTDEEARPIPQKLSMRVSSEMRMLMSGSPIDWDPVAENIRNMVRIVGEDTEVINMNELVVSADEAGHAALSDTLTAQVNGTNKVFVCSQFPIVRPRKVYDLKGVQVGSTVNPIVVTLNSVVRNEFTVNADGSALAAGTYYVMDYNLGELRFVDQTGAAVTPTSAWPLTVTGRYSTNVVKWDSDAVGGETVKARYDRLLTVIGSRKAVIESDRYYMADMVLLSPQADNALTQAESYSANSARLATGLAADGSLGTVKNLAVYNPAAPGLLLNDNRILVGARGNTRFRMVKPWSMNPIEQARDSAGNFIDAQEAFGTQYVVSHTPTQLKNSLTSVVVYSSSGRVARAA